MSKATPILHMLDPRKHVSPFDVNMAADAGFKVIVPYTNVEVQKVTPLIQDAIFSRPPNYGVRTGVFIGGKDAILALDMMEAAKKAMVPPFELSTFADPAGSFTTAAAMVACVERVLKHKFDRAWKGTRGRRLRRHRRRRLRIVRSSPRSKAPHVQLVAHRGVERVIKSGRDIEGALRRRPRSRSPVKPPTRSADIIADAEVIFAAAAAGVQVVSKEAQGSSPRTCSSSPTSTPSRPPVSKAWTCSWTARRCRGCNALGVGPLAIGDIKYKTEVGSLQTDDRIRQGPLARLPRRLRQGQELTGLV